MDFTTVAQNMFPFWILGLFIMYMVLSLGQKHILRVDKKQVVKWIRLLFRITFWRFVLFKVLAFGSIFGISVKNAAIMPIGMSLTVFWEDAVFGVMLFILQKNIGENKWLKPIYWAVLAIAMVLFSSMHLYQGWLWASIIGFYIPLSVKLGKKYGFGTVMICHMLYDLFTMIFVKFIQ